MSEKPMTELLRKSGIIGRHIQEFEKWRLVDPTDGQEGKTAETMVGDLVEEIAALLEEEPVMKQTLLSAHVKPPREWLEDRDNTDHKFYAVEDEMGRLLVDALSEIQRGSRVHPMGEVGVWYLVLEVDALYENEVVAAKMITIEKL